jgi:hypothetical protein
LSVVATIEVTDDDLLVKVEGVDKLWSLKSRLSIPLAHVVGADREADEARKWLHGIRVGGTHVPGLISAGTFHSHGQWVFWDVHDPEKAIGIQLGDERYGKLIVEIADPDEVIDRIRGATG